MGLFNRKPAPKAENHTKNELETLRSFSGMRVEVLGGQQVLFFVAALFVSSTGISELRQMSQLSPGFEYILANWAETVRRTAAGKSGKVDPDRTPIPVHLRGYDEEQNKAIHLSGGIYRLEGSAWRVEQLRHERSENDRAFYRQRTDSRGTAVMLGRVGQAGASVAYPCDIVNISAGGVCIRTRIKYPLGALLQLRFELIPGQPIPPLRCQVLRVTPGQYTGFEYGCKFIDLSNSLEDTLAQAIIELQQRRLQR